MSQQKEMNRRGYLKYVAGGAVVVAVAGVGYGLYAGSQVPSAPTTQTATVTAAPTTVTAAPTTAAPAQVIHSDWWTGQAAFDGDAVKLLVSDYNASHPAHQVTDTLVGSWDDVFAKLSAAYKAKSGLPDGVMMHSNSETVIFGGNAAAAVDDLVNGPDPLDKSDFVKGAWDPCFLNGKQYAIPWDVHCMGLYINIDVFKKYNMDVPVAVKSPDELLDLWRNIKKATGGKVYPTVLDTQTIDLWWMSMANYAMMDDWLTPDLMEPNIRTDKWNHAFEIFDAMCKEKLCPPSNSHTDLITMFGRGDVATNLYGPWMQGTWDAIPGLPYTVCQLQYNYIWGGSHAMFLPRTDSSHDAAMWEFVKWMHLPENIGRYGQYSGMIPSTLSGQAYLPYKVTPTHMIFAAQSAYMKSPQPTVHYWEIAGAFNTDEAKMLVGEDMKTGQDNIEASIKKIIATNPGK